MPVIAHNIASQFTNRQLNITTGKKTKSAEKLSSGYKINRSADDAAGLQISEKMRSQIRGLNQASRNIQDGVSLCQVADGALNETTDILQRMRELSIQSANGTNGESDRHAIQEEIDQLTKEVDRIANTTSFNKDIYPLKGISNLKQINNLSELPFTPCEFPFTLCEFSYTNTTGTPITYDGIIYNVGDTVKGTYFMYEAAKDNNIDGSSPYKYRVAISIGLDSFCNTRLSEGGNTIDVDNLVADSMQRLANHNVAGYSFSSFGTDSDGDTYIARTNGLHEYYGSSPANNGLGYAFSTGKLNGYVYNFSKNINDNSSNSSSSTNAFVENIWIQAGANTGEGLFLTLVDATAKGIGITDPNISVMSEEDCDDAMNRLDDAIKTVSSYRSQFGAYQNRLECAKAVDDNTAENTQYAESRIRDTDMAEEMVEHSKNNILEQVGQSMLAQANQSTQGILSLLG